LLADDQMVKRVLKKHNYPPDKQEKVTQTVLEQANFCARIGRSNETPSR
jgi:hypothetical protein